MAIHEFVTTEDGSLSLATTYENGICEKMHHFRGALSESIYIYEPAINWILQQNLPQVHIMSLGLGLGYNEFIAAAVAAKLPSPPKIQLTTFEIDLDLKTHFIEWLYGRPDAWTEQYDQILNLIANHYAITAKTLKSTLCDWHQLEHWKLQGAFPQTLPQSDQYHAVMYDAFSRKMDEMLWQESFLSEFLRHNVARPAAFATYASTGNLKRALKTNGFEWQHKSGFGGKKESTLAFAAPH